MSGRASTRFIAKHGEVLPHASPSARVTDLLWSVLVWGGSFATSADRARRRGESVDRLIERLDPRLGRRLVAWSVESAGLAGARKGYVHD